ncbi:MAG: hypothetical protein KatS3mg002_0665 [Candidatus Woesearchaeota archaeon]|nr:MAG: hypothetical protein KatS3mg002_0665 [Candidatus Woesearchaeota archaeon]
MKNNFNNDNTYHKTLKYGSIAFLVLLLIESVAYFGFLKFVPNFLSKYLIWIIYLNISVVTLSMSVLYILFNKEKVPCMTGMMIGMTIGMQIGMMIGAVIGATNGYFTGAMVGMILGSIGGTIAGFTSKSTMAWVQGLMSGIMGGTMGPMISVMMFTDRIQIFMPFYMLLNVMLLWGFLKMYHEEVIKDNNDLVRKNVDLITFVSATIIITTLLIIIMIYGPKSPIFASTGIV